MDNLLTLHIQQEVTKIVEIGDLASALPLGEGDAFPAVYATSKMVALMEIAAARVLHPFLQEGELSVGVSVTIQHTAATPVGEEVRARATYLGRDGKLYKFRVEAFDRGGLVGAGEHSRAIVLTERLEGSAAKRFAATGS